MKVTAARRRGGTDPIAQLNRTREIFVKKDVINFVLQRQMMLYGFLDAIVDSFKSDMLGKDTSEQAMPPAKSAESVQHLEANHCAMQMLRWFELHINKCDHHAQLICTLQL